MNNKSNSKQTLADVRLGTVAVGGPSGCISAFVLSIRHVVLSHLLPPTLCTATQPNGHGEADTVLSSLQLSD